MSEYKLEIITPERQFFCGNVESLICHTDDGELCILKGHQMMVTSITEDLIRIKIGDEWKEAFISEGFAEIRPDEVLVFALFCDWSEDADIAKAERERIANEEKQRYENSLFEQKHGHISLTRTIKTKKVKKRS